MVLNNLKNYLKTLALLGGKGYNGTSSSDAWIPAPYPIYNTSGVEQTYFYTVSNSSRNDTPFLYGDGVQLNTSQTSLSSLRTALVLGTGTTPVTAEDYRLEAIIDSNISLSSSSNPKSTVVDKDNEKITRKPVLIYSVKNTGSSDLDVTEAGLICPYCANSTSVVPVMVHREVFDTPLTIPAGGIRTFQFDFEFVNQM